MQLTQQLCSRPLILTSLISSTHLPLCRYGIACMTTACSFDNIKPQPHRRQQHPKGAGHTDPVQLLNE